MPSPWRRSRKLMPATSARLTAPTRMPGRGCQTNVTSLSRWASPVSWPARAIATEWRSRTHGCIVRYHRGAVSPASAPPDRQQRPGCRPRWRDRPALRAPTTVVRMAWVTVTLGTLESARRGRAGLRVGLRHDRNQACPTRPSALLEVSAPKAIDAVTFPGSALPGSSARCLNCADRPPYPFPASPLPHPAPWFSRQREMPPAPHPESRKIRPAHWGHGCHSGRAGDAPGRACW